MSERQRANHQTQRVREAPDRAQRGSAESGLRPPTVAGVGGGVATTTLAVALRARDAGRVVDAADIVVCRVHPDSLRRAATVLDRAGPGPRPVLAVTLDGARAPRGARAQLDRLATGASAVVLLPDVRRWRTLADPLTEAATLLAQPADRLPRPLRSYAAALAELAAAVAASGRLTAAARPGSPPPARVTAPARRDPPGARPAAFPGPAPRADETPRPARGVRIVAVPSARAAAPGSGAVRPVAAGTAAPPAVRIEQVG